MEMATNALTVLPPTEAPIETVETPRPELPELIRYFAGWLQQQRRRRPRRRTWAPAKKAILEFMRTNHVTTLRGLRDGQLECFIEAKLERRNYSRNTLRSDVSVLRRFVDWATMQEGLPDPFEDFRLADYEHYGRREKSRVRRILLHPEWDYLRDHIGRCNVRRRKIPAEDRQALYAAAILTGFRAVECSRLRIMDLHIDGPKKYLELSGRGEQRTKNGKPARQYINANVADRLQRMIERRFAGWAPRLRRVDAPLWKISRTTWSHIAEVLAEDVTAARADYEVQQAAKGEPIDPNFLQVVDANGDVLDFHALRYTCGAWLVHADVDIKTVQTVMRHSSITLTFDTYGRMYPGNDWEAVMELSRWV